jgi:hypothetical protein
VSTVEAAILTLLVFAVAGMLPAVAIAGLSGATPALAILVGAVESAVAGACVLAIAGTILPWYLLLSVLGALLSLPALVRRHRQRPPADRSAHRRSPIPTVATVTALVLTLAACLVPLRVPSVGWDARAIWLLRSSWFLQGHSYVLSAMRNQNPSALITHASYPPLVSTAVAVSWQLTGNHSERLGVVVVTLLNATATFAAAWVIVEIGRSAARNLGPGKRAHFAKLIGAVCAVLFVLVAFDVFGPFATNGYADPLWSVAAVGAIGYGLILPRSRRNVGAAAILLAVSGLTKTEGTATALVLVILIAARYALDVVRPRLHEPPDPGPPRRFKAAAYALWPVAAGAAAAIVSLSLWPALVKVEHTARDSNTSGLRQGTWTSRTHETFTAMAPYLHLLLLVVPVAVISGMVLSRRRSTLRVGNDLWAWLGLLGGMFVVAWAYVSGPGDTSFWLLTSVHRTTMFPAIAAWLILAVWTALALLSLDSARSQAHVPGT